MQSKVLSCALIGGIGMRCAVGAMGPLGALSRTAFFGACLKNRTCLTRPYPWRPQYLPASSSCLLIRPFADGAWVESWGSLADLLISVGLNAIQTMILSEAHARRERQSPTEGAVAIYTSGSG